MNPTNRNSIGFHRPIENIALTSLPTTDNKKSSLSAKQVAPRFAPVQADRTLQTVSPRNHHLRLISLTDVLQGLTFSYLSAKDLVLLAQVSQQFKSLLNSTTNRYLLPSPQSTLGNSVLSVALRGLLAQKRAAVLDSKQEDVHRRQALQALYPLGKAYFTAEVVQHERAAILTSTLSAYYQRLALMDLYQTGQAHISAEIFQSERIAILASRMSGDYKAWTLSALYYAAQRNITSEIFQGEWAAIWASGIRDDNKSVALQALYTVGQAHINSTFLQLERARILASSMESYFKSEALTALYQASKSHITAEIFQQEYRAIAASNLDDINKVALQRVLSAAS